MRKKIKILVVDDTPADLMIIQSALENEDVEIIVAASGPDALDLTMKNHAELILLDARMPCIAGFEVAERFRKNEKTRHIPIIFIAQDETDGPHGFIGYEKGMVDYLFKPLDPMIVRDKVHVFVEGFQRRRRLQTLNVELSRTVSKLESANREIQDRQASVIEEERLKVLLEMAGTTGHELNQPLMALMGNIQLLEIDDEIPAHLNERIKKINAAAARIADTIKKIQTLRYNPPKSPHSGGETLLSLDQPVSILCLEEKDADYTKIQDILASHKELRLVRAQSIQDVIDLLEKESFDLVFIDYLLNDEAGLQLLEILNRRDAEIPVVAITHRDDTHAALNFIQAGGSDYLVKSELNERLMLRVIAHAMEKSRLKRELRIAQEKLSATTVRDPLTKMFNKRYLNEILEREIFIARRYGRALALCLFDIDNLKKINRLHGYPCGDRIVQTFSRLLGNHIRKYDVACRYGGGTFAVIFPDITLEKAIERCQTFRDQVQDHTFTCMEQPIRITVRIGITTITDMNTSRHQLTEAAEKALNQAKNCGQSGIVAV